MKYKLYEDKVRVKATGKVGIIVDDIGRTKDGKKVLIIEYDDHLVDDPVGDFLEEELELLT